ncbi:8-oxo-dGTP diphosphatase MutT [Gracilinema caldarium]|uniref:8-oxo-dGTP diphosphatase n=1 Tax=Gracilinema caldarium (strain ATCC 51460 / DSM 7334 / H1) TaxID=744872 RepID=F8EY71_GRAC1|nr:8-oxo-dGTP diphosphatase MutT [Gracilinema caldarium]AEJ18230.1 mutator MutT protein [Gracilinema caldarium DSM 7334]
MIAVTAAVILHDGKVLIAQRALDKKLAGKWEFPGGKIEPGETPEACLIREIQEELGVTIEVERFFTETEYHYDTEAIRLLAYIARWIDGNFQLTAHSQIQWVTPSELESYDFAPADVPIVKKLKDILSKNSNVYIVIK